MFEIILLNDKPYFDVRYTSIYLYAAKIVSWQDGKKTCDTVGGHAVHILYPL